LIQIYSSESRLCVTQTPSETSLASIDINAALAQLFADCTPSGERTFDQRLEF